jgi:hypothetical protein
LTPSVCDACYSDCSFAKRNLSKNGTPGGMNELSRLFFAEGKVSKNGSRFCTDDPGDYIVANDGNEDVCTVMSQAPDGMK